MSWSDPCSKCGFHRADCECNKNKYLVDEAGLLPFHNNKVVWDLATQKLIEKGSFTTTEELTLDQIKERYGNILSKEEIKKIEDFINPPLKYLETLPKAYKIYEKLLGQPKTHREWAERFNIVGDINEIIMRK